ncbi:MAG: hypothetical protein JW727_04190 [Candidatus Aenigmarchaeota archaeon]|nr:hypothetical protein [Candidatus Aenigmarchaeota archaeon]
MFDVALLVVVGFFVLFVYLFYRAMKLFVKFIAVVGISALFPVILVKVFGVGWNLTTELMLSFVMIGVMGFFIYYGLAILEVLTKSFTDSAKIAFGVNKKRRRQSRYDDDLE